MKCADAPWRPAAAHPRGLTMVEVVISTAILSVMVVGALNVVGALAMTQVSNRDHSLANALAADLMAEILSHVYADPEGVPGFGPEGLEATSTRAAFDDVDDYDQWQAEPPVDAQGNPVPGAEAYARQVVVEWVNPEDLSAVRASESGVKRITVSVSRAGVELARLEGIRTSAWTR